MGEKIFKFFKRIFGRRAEFERKVALLEINYELLKKQYEELNKTVEELSKTVEEVKKQHEELNENYKKLSTDIKELKTVSARTLAEDVPPTSKQIINEWLNGEENDDE